IFGVKVRRNGVSVGFEMRPPQSTQYRRGRMPYGGGRQAERASKRAAETVSGKSQEQPFGRAATFPRDRPSPYFRVVQAGMSRPRQLGLDRCSELVAPGLLMIQRAALDTKCFQ